MVYAPELLVVALRIAHVPTDLAVTVAPLTTAPLGSVTVPVIVPVSLCPNTYTEQRARTLRKHSNFVITFMSCHSTRGELRSEQLQTPRQMPPSHDQCFMTEKRTRTTVL